MYKNRIKTPRLYTVAAKIAKQVSEGAGSIKQVLYTVKHPNLQGVYALVTNTFQRLELIDSLLKKSKFLTKEKYFDPWLAKILITEMLWRKKQLTGHCPKIKTILAYEQIFKAHISDNPSQMADIEKVEKPRYVRVNTLKTSVNEMVEEFRNEGWILKRYLDSDNYSGFLEAVSTLGPEEFMVDLHIPSLLVFPPKTKFYKHPAYKSGKILLQDKASCISVHLLNPEPGSTILDMCAAPGMKTTQAAAAIQDKGRIYAVETVPKRYEILNKLVESFGATCIKTISGDVLELRETDLPDVEYIIVDPSCSGSGITDRVEIGQQKKDQDPTRLEKLSNLQKQLLRYAFTRHPKAKRVVYSTCSLFPEENEDVVRQVMETCHNFKLVPAGPLLNGVWLNYGSSDFGDIGNYCLYARPDIDLTTGFFVAVFERCQPGEENPFRSIHLFPSQRVEKKRKMLQDYLDDVNARDTIAFNKENNLKQKKIKKEVVKEEETVVKKEADENSVKKEKKKKEKNLNGDYDNKDGLNLDVDVGKSKSKKKKKKHKIEDTEMENGVKTEDAQKSNLDDGETTSKKKKRKHKTDDTQDNEIQIEDEQKSNLDVSESKSKKKKKHSAYDPETENEIQVDDAQNSNLDVSVTKRKKKKKQHKTEDTETENGFQEDRESSNLDVSGTKSKKKKKKHKTEDTETANGIQEDTETSNLDVSETKSKKKKKKHKTEDTELEDGNQKENEQNSNFDVSETKSKKKKKTNGADMDSVNQMEDELNVYLDETKSKKKKKEK